MAVEVSVREICGELEITALEPRQMTHGMLWASSLPPSRRRKSRMYGKRPMPMFMSR